MAYAYYEKLARINLTTGTITVEKLDTDLAKKFIGGRGLGTASLVNVINGVGSLPTKNWQEAYYDKAEDISGEALAEKYLVKAGACHRCPIACGRIVKVVGGPEYEPLWAYGANMANNDLAAGMKPEDDRLPKRLLEEPIPAGPSKGLVSQLPVTLPEYYKVRGWEAAFPTDETLKRLGLDECIGK